MLSLIPTKSRRLYFEPFSLDRFFDEPILRSLGETRRDWSPAVEVFESNNELILTAEVPGVDEKDLHISVADGFLTVSGERFSEKREDRQYLRSERRYGKFTRSFQLPETADLEKIDAHLRNGVLRLNIPKKAEARPRQIEVDVN